MGAVRMQVAAATRRLPRTAGTDAILRRLERLLPAAPMEPMIVPMRLGHRMLLNSVTATERSPFYTGFYNDDVILLLAKLHRPGEAVLDVGAHIGFYAIPLALRVAATGGRVLAFEPFPPNFARLSANIALNGADKAIEACPLGLSSKDATAEMALRDQGATAVGNASLILKPHADHLAVTLTSLDLFFARQPAPRVGVVKVDIEGHEDQFLAGAHSFLLHQRPIVFMEVNRPYFAIKSIDIMDAIRAHIPADYVFLRPCYTRAPPLFARCLTEFVVIRDVKELPSPVDDVLICPPERLADLSAAIQISGLVS